MRLHELIAKAPPNSYLARRCDLEEIRYVRLEVTSEFVRLKVFNEDTNREEECSYVFKEDFEANDWIIIGRWKPERPEKFIKEPEEVQ